MNTSCPTCGAIYNVAAKDIGRKLKCKKCSTALKVTEAGLEVDGGTGTAPPVESSKTSPVPAAVADEYEGDDEPVVKKKKKGKYERTGPRVNPIEAVGGIPTILFSFGVFLVVVCSSLPRIGEAGTERASAYVERLNLDKQAKLEGLVPKGKKLGDLSGSELDKYNEDAKKIEEDFSKQMKEAKTDADRTRIANIRDKWFERYGLMFGFLFVSFGSIGYLRTEQPLVLKIVAASILFVMLWMMFMMFAGCSVPK